MAGVTMMPGVYPTVILEGWAAARVAAAAWAAERSSAFARGRNTSPALVSRVPCGVRSSRLRAELLLELADLPAQRRLRDAQLGGGAAEVPMLGDGGEVPHQPQVQVDRVFQIRHNAIVHSEY